MATRPNAMEELSTGDRVNLEYEEDGQGLAVDLWLTVEETGPEGTVLSDGHTEARVGPAGHVLVVTEHGMEEGEVTSVAAV